MKTGPVDYRKRIRTSASNGVIITRKWVENASKLALKHRLQAVSVITFLVALFSMYFLAQKPPFLLIGLMVGSIAMVIDAIVECKGINNKEWKYPMQYISYKEIPLELPILFFGCGVLMTFVYYCFTYPIMQSAFITPSGLGNMTLVQIILVITGSYFSVQYFRKKNKSIIFGALPISLAFYLSHPEPWILVVSIVPLYIDYLLEKRLVKSAHIEYNEYDDEVAINVAISYFASAMWIMGTIAILYHLLG